MKTAIKIIAVTISILPATLASAQDTTPTDRVPAQSLVEGFSRPFGAAPTRTSRSINHLTLSLIKHFEGWSAKAYDDPVGYCTIGYGHLIALTSCKTISLGVFSGMLTEDAGSKLLEQDTVLARLAVHELVTTNLNENQFGALASFVFNVGQTKFASSTLLKLVNIGEFDQAANQFPRWVRANNQTLKGLVDRRTCEAFLFNGILKADQNGGFDRLACQAPVGAAADVGSLIDIDVGEQ